MRTVLLVSLHAHGRRYAAAGIAVIVSVAFIVVIGVLTAGARAGLVASSGAPYRDADVVVDADPENSDPSGRPYPDVLDSAAAVALVERLGEDASPLGRVLLPARRADGTPLDHGTLRGETTVGPIAGGDALRWQTLITGRFPTGPGEAVVHVWDADSADLAVGDRVRVGEGTAAVDLVVVGLVESPSTWSQASFYVTWPQYLHWRDQPTWHVGSVAVRGDPGPLPAGVLATPAQVYVEENLARLTGGTDATALMLLLFAAVAVVVSGLVVATTFAAVFAQRRREIALLRCVGATRRQVLGAVCREALVLGVLASLAGTVAGAGLGYGLIAVLPSMDVPAPPVPWLLGGFAVGVLVTLVASAPPAWNAARVHPLVALRQGSTDDRGPAGGSAGGLLVAGGTVLLAQAMAGSDRIVLVVGGAAVFGGVLLLGPVLIPPAIRAAGALLGRRGRLATANAVRHPRRTATTTAALLIGVTLTAAVLTGSATWRTAIGEHRDTRLPIDVAITSADAPLPDELLDQVRATPGVADAIAVTGTVAQLPGWADPIPVVAAPDAARVARDGGAFARVPPGTIVIDEDAFRGPRHELSLRPGDPVAVAAGESRVDLEVVLLGGWGSAAVVAPETLARLTGSPEPRVLWVRAGDDADPLQLVDALDDLADAAGARIEDHLQARTAGEREFAVLTWSVLGLLSVSVAIALIGIGNTVSLSVLERDGEHALLRAIGLTRRGLRRMIATEAALMAVVAAVLGTALGVAFAWVAHVTVVLPILSRASLQVPWPALAAVVLGIGLAALIAGIVPVHRTAR